MRDFLQAHKETAALQSAPMRQTTIACAAVAASLLQSNAFAQTFVDRTAEVGITGGGEHAAWGDVNGDGWPDLWMGGAVWLNHDGKSFTRIDAPGAGVIADIDNDGVGDLVSFAPPGILRGVREAATASGAIRFMPVPYFPADLPATVARGAAVGDFNNDGFVDVYIGGFENWETQTTFPSLLLLNDHGKAFKLASSSAERRARGITACDFDEDGDLDIYASNYRLQPNTLLVNDGHAKFTDQAAKRNAIATSAGFEGGHSIGACFGDFDGDGHIDLFAGNFAHVDSRGDQPKCRFLRNLGPANAFRFEDLGECGIYYQESYASPACGDFDNDGALDLFLTTVYANASFGKKNFPVLFRNTSIGSAIALVDVTQAAGLSQLPATYVGAWADYDHDGDLDLATAGRMYANNGTPGAHWLELRLIGDGVKINRDAIGAQARIALADGRVLVREVEAGTGEGNANSPILHFGLGAFAGPATVTVRWPDGSTQVAKDLAVDRIVEIAPKPPTQTLAK